jgi:hypothetical protein
MSLDQEFTLEPDDRTPEADPPAAPAVPLVVIQYRNRGIHPAFLVPLLIVVIGSTVLALKFPPVAHPRVVSVSATEPRPTSEARKADRRPVREPGAAAAEPAPVRAEYEPIVLRSQGLPSPASAFGTEPPAKPSVAEGVVAVAATAPAPPVERAALDVPALQPPQLAPRPAGALPGAKPAGDGAARDPAAPRPPVSPFELVPAGGDRAGTAAPAPTAAAQPGRRPAVGFTPPAEDEPGDDGPGDQPKMSKADVEADIEREAAEKRAERRPIAPEDPKSRLEELADAITRAHQQRVVFHAELDRLVTSGPQQGTGAAIERLCAQYGRNPPAAIRKFVTHEVATSTVRMTTRDRVEMMRRFGIPEPSILDFLCQQVERRTLNARGGPKTQDDVRVRAAKQLLAIPIARSKPGDAERAAIAIARYAVARTSAPGPRGVRRP